MLVALRNRDYRLLWSGQTISYLGDQFHLVALPFLVLAITHDPLQLGLVFAAAGIPRALVMLAGGAIADRFSPRLVMLASNLLRFAVVGALAVAIATGGVQLWMVYVLAVVFGLVSGIFLPAAEASVPRLLPSRDLEAGNSLMMIADHIAMFVGPALAGTLIALLSGAAHAGAESMAALAAAFAVDAASFLVSSATLVMMRPLPGLGSDKHPLHDIADGLRFAIGRPPIRLLIIVIALANLFATGPLLVGMPVLASTRLPQGAAAFGLIISASSLGNLIGMTAAGVLRRPSSHVFGFMAPAVFAVFAVVYGSFAIVNSTVVACALMAFAGLGNGYVAIIVITALQRLTPKELIGRVMSLLMLAMFGLAPLSQALAGALIKVSLPVMFIAVGAGLALTGVVAFAYRDMWSFGDETDLPAPAFAEEPEAA